MASGAAIHSVSIVHTPVNQWARAHPERHLNSWSGGGTLTISFYLNGAANIVLNVPAGTAAGSYLNADFDCTIRGTNLCRTQGVLLAAGQHPVLMDGGGTWTKTSSNNVDVLFTFSIASAGNIISPLSLTIETHYQT